MDEEFDPTSIGAVAVVDEPEFDPRSIGAIPVDEEEFDPVSIGAVPVEETVGGLAGAPATSVEGVSTDPKPEFVGGGFNGKAALDAVLSPFNDFTAAVEGSLPSNPRRDEDRQAGRLLTKEEADAQIEKSKEAMQTPIVTFWKPTEEGTMAGIETGLLNVAETLTTGENLALLASIGGAPKVIQKAAAAGFGGMMAAQAPAMIDAVREAETPKEKARTITELTATAAMVGLAAKHVAGRPTGRVVEMERAASMEKAKAAVEAQKEPSLTPITDAVVESMPKVSEALATQEALPPAGTPVTESAVPPKQPVEGQSPALAEVSATASPESISKNAAALPETPTTETLTAPRASTPDAAKPTTPAERGAAAPLETAARAEAETYMKTAKPVGGFVTIPHTVLDRLMPETSTTPNAYRVGPVAQGVRNWWFGKGGALPKEIRETLGENRNNIAAIQSEGMLYASDMKGAIDRVTKVSKDKEAPRKLVNDVLEGVKPLEDIADFELRDTVRRARNFVDALSQTAIDKGAVTGNMADTFRSNMGTWLRRYYAAFDAEAGRTYDNVVRAAYADPIKRTGLKDARLASQLKAAEAEVRKNRPDITDGEVEGVLRGLLDRDALETTILGKPGTDKISKDISSLVRRKEIPEPIRNWMGEERNPLLRFEKSLNFMAQLISRHDAQTQIREFGLKNSLFSTEKTGRFTQQMAEGSKTKDVLAGLYTTPEFARALRSLDPVASGIQSEFAAVGKVLSMVSAEAKAAKVPLNPDSWVTNALGGFMMNLANGTATPFQPVKTGKLFSTAMQAMNASKPTTVAQRSTILNQQVRELHTRLVKDGILDSSVTLKDFEASSAAFAGSFLETSKVANSAVGAARLAYYGSELGGAVAGPPGAAVGAVMGGVTGGAIGGKQVRKGLQKLSELTIGKSDNFFKVVSYLDNFETYARAFPNKPQAEISRMAAAVTLDTMPTYSKVPQGLRSLSKLGFINSFLNFNYEVLRNTFNTVAIGTKEMKSGNPVLQARGARRLAGVSAMIAAASSVAAQQISKMLIDDDDGKKQEALNRSFLPEWDKNNSIVVTDLKAGDSVSYVNHGYILPQEFITKAATAGMAGGTWEESVENVFDAYASDLLSAGVHIAPLMEAAVNQKGFRSFFDDAKQGSQVTYKSGFPGAAERIGYVLDKTIKPGAVGKAEKIKKAITGEMAEYGRKYTLDEQAKRFLGLRENTYDLKQGLEFKMRDLQSQWRNVGNVERNVERKNLPADKAADDTAYVAKERARLKKEMETLKKDAATLGLSSSKITDAQKNADIPVALR